MGARNAATVKAMWDAFQKEGVDAFLRLAPDDVEWHPSLADGRVLRGSHELREFYAGLDASGDSFEVTVDSIEELDGEVVLLTGTITREGRTQPLAWLYAFRDGRLWRASSHATVAEAREAARFIASPTSRWGAPLQSLEIEESRVNGQVVLRPAGELDLSTAAEVAGAITRAAATTGDVVLDLAGLKFIDSSGLRCLLEAAEQAQEGDWRLTLLPGREPVQRVFGLAGVEDLLPFRA